MAEPQALSFDDLMGQINALHGEWNPQHAMRVIDGRYGPMTPDTRRGAPTPEMRAGNLPTTGERIGNAMLEYGPIPAQIATGMAMQPVRAGEAIAEAINDPSIPTATNAAFQTAATFARPAAAIGSLAAGYGAALAKDVGLLDGVSPAHAAPKGSQVAMNIPDLPGLTPEDNAAYRQTMDQLKRGAFSSGAERRALEAQAGIFLGKAAKSGTDAAEVERMKSEAAQAEYDRSVRFAEAARDKELSRVRRFSGTEFGKVYDKTGGAGAAAAAIAAGALMRAASGPGAGAAETFAKNYMLPAIEGTGAAFTANSIPTIYDARLTDSDNPEKAAYLAYARELPPGHPRKAEMQKYADSLPDANPVRTTATKDYYDGMASTIGMSALEGIPGGITGANAPRLFGRMFRRKLGATKGGPASPPSSPATPPGGPPPAIPAVGGQGPPQGPPPALPQTPVAYNDTLHRPVAREFLNELLTQNHPTRSASLRQPDTINFMTRELNDRFRSAGLPAPDIGDLTNRAKGTRAAASDLVRVLGPTNARITAPRIRDSVLNAISGKSGMLSVGGAAIGGNLMIGGSDPANAAYDEGAGRWRASNGQFVSGANK